MNQKKGKKTGKTKNNAFVVKIVAFKGFRGDNIDFKCLKEFKYRFPPSGSLLKLCGS